MATVFQTPQLNLYNFDKPEAQDSRYVLTSPRSLEACSRLHIKPLSLLPMSLEAFERQHSGKSPELIKLLYNQWERKRLSKLDRCREARENMIKEDYLATKKVDGFTKQSFKVEIKPNKQSEPRKFGDFSLSKTKLSKDQPSRKKVATKKECKNEATKTEDSASKEKSRKSRSVMFAVSPFASNKLPKSSYKWIASSLQLNTSNMQRDKKLVNLMKERMQEGEKEEEKKMLKWKEWDEIRKEEEVKKRHQVLKLNKNIAMSRIQWQRKLQEKENQKKAETKEQEQDLLRIIEESETHHCELVEQQRKMKLMELKERQDEMNQRKIRQAKSFEELQKRAEQFQKSTEKKLNKRMKKAERLRLEKELKELENIKMMNCRERKRFEQIHLQLKEERQIDELKKAKDLEDKLIKAEDIRNRLLENGDRRCNANRLSERIQETRKNHERINNENERRIQELVGNKNKQLKKAEEIARTNAVIRASKTHNMRNMFEHKWKINYRKIHLVEEETKKKTQKEINQKNNRLERHLQLKESRANFTRHYAQINELERESLKRKYNNFNKMAQQAKLLNSIGHGPRTAMVNHSNVDLMC